MKEERLLAIAEVAKVLAISETDILKFISSHWIIPADQTEYLLDHEDFARTRYILELQSNFGVNDAGIEIILHLTDQLYSIHFKK